MSRDEMLRGRERPMGFEPNAPVAEALPNGRAAARETAGETRARESDDKASPVRAAPQTGGGWPFT